MSGKTASKLKIPAVEYKSDSCVIHVGRVIVKGQVTAEGIPYNVHKGEKLSLLPVSSMDELINIGKLTRALASEQQDAESVAEAAEAFDSLCEVLSKRVYSWTWTDLDGDPLPQPYQNPAAIRGLNTEELFWILNVVQGEAPEERKNDSGPSATT